MSFAAVDEDDLDLAVVRVMEKVEKATARESGTAVAVALATVAAKRARRAGCTQEEFFEEVCKAAWKMSVER